MFRVVFLGIGALSRAKETAADYEYALWVFWGGGWATDEIFFNWSIAWIL